MATMNPFGPTIMSDFPMTEQNEDLMDVATDMERQNAVDEDIEIDFDFTEDVQQDEVMTEGDSYGSHHGLLLNEHGEDIKDDEMADEDQDIQYLDEEIVDAPANYVEEIHTKSGNISEHMDPSNTAAGFVPFPNMANDMRSAEHSEQFKVPETALKAPRTREEVGDISGHTALEESETALLDNSQIVQLQEQDRSRAVQAADTNHQSSPSPARTNQISSEVYIEEEEERQSLEDHPANDFTEDLFSEPAETGEMPVQHQALSIGEINSSSIEAKDLGDSSKVPSQLKPSVPTDDLSPTAVLRDVLEDANEDFEANHDGSDLEHHEEAENSSDDESLHPIIVHYLDEQMSLFPPREDEDSDMYFLADQALVHQNLKSLFEAFRSVLGESISEIEELSLKIYALDLEISEVAEEASEASLAQLLQLYLNLTRNDGMVSLDPLRLRLKRKQKFIPRLNYLRDHADGGKGFKELLGDATHTVDEVETHLEPLQKEDEESNGYEGAGSESVTEQPHSPRTSSRHIDEKIRTPRRPGRPSNKDGFDFDFRGPLGAQKVTDHEARDPTHATSQHPDELDANFEHGSRHEAEAISKESYEIANQDVEHIEGGTHELISEETHNEAEFVATPEARFSENQEVNHGPNVDHETLRVELSGESSTLQEDEDDLFLG